MDDQPRDDQCRPALGLVHQRRRSGNAARRHLQSGGHLRHCPDGKNNLNANCVGRVTNWKDLNPRFGISYDLSGNGKTAVKASIARYVNGVGLAAGSITDNNNPETTVGLLDARPWRDVDGNGSPFDADGSLQANELSPSTTPISAATSRRRRSPIRRCSKDGSPAPTTSIRVSAQHELAPRVSISGGWYRRQFGNQTVTVDQRTTRAATTVRSASPRRRIRTCRVAAAIRSAASTI